MAAVHSKETLKNGVSPFVLAGRINGLADGIAEYIYRTLELHGRLPARSFYGESFSSLLLGSMGPRYAGSAALLRELYKKKDKDDPGFHWEFNKYAWCALWRKTDDEKAKELALPLRFRNTPVTNWALLRSCTRYLAETEIGEAHREAAKVLRHSQLRSGLICDERNVRSFQYHCFSAVLAAEIYEKSGEPFFLERFRSAADFIERFVLRTGDTLYVGRGQEQSFGYGALCYLLATAFRFFGNCRYLSALEKSLCFLEGYRRRDGSFPLVMNGIEVGYPQSASPADPRFTGWYAYNNYFDYIPFLGVFLRKAAEALGKVCEPYLAGILLEQDYRDSDFLIFRNARYEAVVSRPGGGWKGGDGYWTNDLPFPYVVRDGERVTLSFGGEQFESTLYSPAGIPLPVLEWKGCRKLLRDGRVWSFFMWNRLFFISTKGILVRRFRFLEDEIIVDDVQMGPGKIFSRYLFDQLRKLDERTFVIRGGAVVRFSAPMEIEDSREFYWGGPLQALAAQAPSRRCTVHLYLGDKS